MGGKTGSIQFGEKRERISIAFNRLDYIFRLKINLEKSRKILLSKRIYPKNIKNNPRKILEIVWDTRSPNKILEAPEKILEHSIKWI